MTVRLETLDRGDDDALVALLTGSDWPFHGGGRPSADDVRSCLAAGAYDGPGVLTCWVVEDGVDDGRGARDAVRPAGLLRAWDLADETALVDVRLAQTARGRGIGTAALRLFVARLFTDHPGVRRVEATTRRDNAAMRRVLERCGFVQEAVYREGWPVDDGRVLDAIGYALLRRDWSSGTTTPVRWD